MVNGISGNGSCSVHADRFAGVRVDIKTGKVTAGDIQPEAMPFFEQVAGGIKADIQPVHFSWLHRFAALTTFPVPGAEDTVRQIEGIALRVILTRRINVNQLGGKVSVRSRRRDPEFDRNRAGDFDISLQG